MTNDKNSLWFCLIMLKRFFLPHYFLSSTCYLIAIKSQVSEEFRLKRLKNFRSRPRLQKAKWLTWRETKSSEMNYESRLGVETNRKNIGFGSGYWYSHMKYFTHLATKYSLIPITRHGPFIWCSSFIRSCTFSKIWWVSYN